MELSHKFKIFIGLFISLQCLLIVNEACSQDKYIVLEKLGRKKRVLFYPGDDITYKLKNSDLEISDVITDLHDSLVLFTNSYVKPKEIDYVKVEHVAGLLSPSNGPKLIIAGVTLFVIDQLNHSVLQGNEFRIDREITIVSFVMVAGGALWTSFRYTRFRNKGNRRIRIVII